MKARLNKSKTEKVKSLSVAERTLKDYVDASRRKNISDAVIKKKLLEAGWDRKLIKKFVK